MAQKTIPVQAGASSQLLAKQLQPLIEKIISGPTKEKLDSLLTVLPAIGRRPPSGVRSWNQEEAVQQVIDTLFSSQAVLLIGSRKATYEAIASASSSADALDGAVRAFGITEGLQVVRSSSDGSEAFFRLCNENGYSTGAFELLVKQTSAHEAFDLAVRAIGEPEAFRLCVNCDELALPAYSLLSDAVGGQKAFNIASSLYGANQAKKLMTSSIIPISPELVHSLQEMA